MSDKTRSFQAGPEMLRLCLLEVRSRQCPKPEKRGLPSPSWRDGSEERLVAGVRPGAGWSKLERAVIADVWVQDLRRCLLQRATCNWIIWMCTNCLQLNAGKNRARLPLFVTLVFIWMQICQYAVTSILSSLTVLRFCPNSAQSGSTSHLTLYRRWKLCCC
jgi:hypothetical protein